MKVRRLVATVGRTLSPTSGAQDATRCGTAAETVKSRSGSNMARFVKKSRPKCVRRYRSGSPQENVETYETEC